MSHRYLTLSKTLVEGMKKDHLTREPILVMALATRGLTKTSSRERSLSMVTLLNRIKAWQTRSMPTTQNIKVEMLQELS